MTSSARHFPALDGLRGAAVLLVVLFHGFPRLLPGGFLGVDIFFVLSGFLIADGLLAERQQRGRIAIGRFLLRRALRLGPALLVLLAAWLAWAALQPAPFEDALLDAGLVLGGLANWTLALGLERPGLLAHAWSLAVELQFYLLCPLLALGLAHPLVRRWAPLLLLAAILGLAVWRAGLEQAGATPLRLFTGFDTRAGALLAGTLLAVMLRTPLGCFAAILLARLAAPAGALLLLRAATLEWTDRALDLGGFELVALLALALVAAARLPFDNPVRRLLSARPLVQLGAISYGVYLWHFPVIWIVAGDPALASPAMLLGALGLTLVLAVASHRLVEQPVLAWHRRLGRAAPRLPLAAQPAV